jgi:hypothetical protein
MPEKEIGEETVIKVKLGHVFALLGGLVTVLSIVIGFFYTTLSTSIEKKVEKELYEQNKEYLDEKFDDFGKDLEDIKKEQKVTNDNLRTIGTEVKIINAERNNTPNNNPVPINNQPINPEF